MRGNAERTGGDQAAREMFRKLTDREPLGSFDRIVMETTEVVYRAEGKSGVPKVEIIDHTRKLFKKISFT